MAHETAAMPAWRERSGNATVATESLPFALLLGLAWLLVACQLLALGWHGTALSLNDTDDAMRLVEMRAFLDGKGWFDLHEPRVQPPTGYETHWSRLIDAGLAGLSLLFRIFMDPASAERVTRTLWPLIWLLPTIAASAAIAWRLAGRPAALVALLFAAFALPLCQQFVPGRIDHHNVQIAVALVTLAAVIWSDRLPWTAGLAGVVTGFGLAIGLEALPYLAGCGAALAIRYVFDRDAASALRSYGTCLALSTLAAFLISVPPARWSVPACDAIVVNLLAGVLTAAGTLVMAAWVAPRHPIGRIAWAAAAGGAAAAVTLWLEPRCLAGPFALMDPAVWTIWLSHVTEMQPLVRTLQDAPLLAMTTMPFLAAAFVAAGVLASDPRGRYDFALLATAAMLALAALMTLAAVKTLSYALWFAPPLVAALALRVCERFGLVALVPRFIAALLMTPLVFAAGSLAFAHMAGIDTGDPSKAERKACFATANYESLARLPAGLVVTNIDFGPFLLAHTPHAVMATPYHRAGQGILSAHNILAEPPAAARKLFAQAGGTYVAICGPRGPVAPLESARGASLWAELQAGTVPEWLEHLPLEPGHPFKVYRLRQ